MLSSDTAPGISLRLTESLCPVCFRRIPARYERATSPDGAPDVVELIKECPEHGGFRVPIWRGAPAFSGWSRPKTPSFPAHPAMPRDRGCPFDCGLCPDHGQHTCTGLIEITACCNLRCPVCYADAGTAPPPDPDRERIAAQLDALWAASGPCNVQLSGGEPTVRDDLPDIIGMARRRGFSFVQVNTNGLRLGTESGYARRLAEAGLASVYLQCDGPDDVVIRPLRGRDCLREKLAAVEACAEAGLGVVLVATVAAGVNDHRLGDLLRLALDCGPAVRGLHLQPAASFGRYPWTLPVAPRLTLPELLQRLEDQSGGMIRAEHAHPPGCEHSLCSFSMVYRRQDGSEGVALHPLPQAGGCCDGAAPPPAAEGARKSKRFTALHWTAPAGAKTDAVLDDFDRFLAQAGTARRFTVSAMAFQDAYSLDLDRVRGCCIHVVAPSGRLIPFCLYNLTSTEGTPLYRGKC